MPFAMQVEGVVSAKALEAREPGSEKIKKSQAAG